VVRVLVSDLYTSGMIDVHDTAGDAAQDITLLHRLIDRVRAIA
jgi:Protein of unknown function (DUF742)